MCQLITGLLGSPLGAVYPFWSAAFQVSSGLLGSTRKALYLALFRSAGTLSGPQETDSGVLHPDQARSQRARAARHRGGHDTKDANLVWVCKAHRGQSLRPSPQTLWVSSFHPIHCSQPSKERDSKARDLAEWLAAVAPRPPSAGRTAKAQTSLVASVELRSSSAPLFPTRNPVERNSKPCKGGTKTYQRAGGV